MLSSSTTRSAPAHTPTHAAQTRRAATLAVSIMAAASFSAALFTTGCGEADADQQAHAAGQAAPQLTLDAAIVAGDDHAVHAHILAGTPVDTPNAEGNTPLSMAAVMGRTYAAEVLIGAGAALESKNLAGTTPLFNAAFFCHPDVLRLLIDAGADTGTADPNGVTILQVMETPWEHVKPIYSAVYASIGVPFDAARIESMRPKIADMLR